MGFYSSYNNVFSQLQTTLETIDSIKQVVLGEQFRLSNLPLAVINPSSTRISQGNIGEMLELRVNGEVIVVVRETEPEDWFTEIVSVMGDVMDAVLSDRTLSDNVLDINPREFTPGEITFSNQLYYGGLLVFEILLHYHR